ncbi:MAG: IS1634 family transposase [Planctomycetota bacterium]
MRQRVMMTLGNYQHWKDSGKLDSLLASGARLSEKLAVISEHQAGKSRPVSCKCIGPDKIFGRLWDELGLGDIIRSCALERKFKFDVERAVYRTVMHRIFESGSDRASLKWDDDFEIAGAEDLDLQHLYRAMGFLGGPIKDQRGAMKFAPRCTKDLVEERLFGGRRDLFSNLSMVFFDTTSIYFEGEGGETLGEYGYSKDHRSDRKQMLVGVVIDGDGMPLCCEMWPGDTADVSTIGEVVKRFQNCFGIREVCIVADRGMISGEMLEFLESPECSFSYILGVRMRKVKEVRCEVLADPGGYQEIKRANPRHEPLKVKEVKLRGRRYVICVNERQARKDAHDRDLIVESLLEKLKSGDKSLIGNSGYRKFLKTKGRNNFQIDEEKILQEAIFDGKWVLTSNTSLSASELALQYKQLWMVENVFRTMKSGLDTRPIFHRLDRTIRGHVFCSFLAILLRRELERRVAEKGYDFEWNDILHDLASIKDVTAEISGKTVIFRSEMKGCAGKVFQSAGVAVPPALRFV